MYSNFKMKKYRYSSVSRTAKKPLVFYNNYREAIASYCRAIASYRKLLSSYRKLGMQGFLH